MTDQYERKESDPKFESKLGDREVYADDLSKELMARGRSVFGAEPFTPEPATIMEEKTTVINQESEPAPVTSFLTMTRRATGFKAEFIGVAEPNELAWVCSGSGLNWHEIRVESDAFAEMFADKETDEHIALILLFESVKPTEAEFRMDNDRVEWIMRVTADAVIRAKYISSHREDIEKDSEIAKLVEEKKAKEADAARVRFVDAKLKLAREEWTKVQEILAKDQQTLAEPDRKKLEEWNNAFQPYVEIPVIRLEKALEKVISALKDEKMLKKFIDRGQETDTSIALFPKMKPEAVKVLGKESFFSMGVDGTITFSSSSEARKTQIAANLYDRSFLDGHGIVNLPKEVKPKDSVDIEAIRLRMAKTSALLRRPRGQESDEYSSLLQDLSIEELTRIPQWYYYYEMFPMWTERELWQLTGRGCNSSATAARLWLFRLTRCIGKIRFFMNRCPQINMTMIDGSTLSMQGYFDLIASMDKGFDVSKVNKYFYDSRKKTLDLQQLNQAISMHQSMMVTFQTGYMSDGKIQHFGVWDEVMSQYPEFFDGMYFITNVFSTINLKSTELHLLTQYKKTRNVVAPHFKEILGMLKLVQPNISILSTSGANVIDVFRESGILFAPQYTIELFGDFAGSMPLFGSGIPFGKPKVKPLLIANFGWDEQSYEPEANKKKYNSVFVRARVGIHIWKWTDDFKIERVPDTLSVSDFPKKDDISTTIGISGTAKLDSYVLMSKINIKEFIYQDEYVGSAGVIFRPGGH